MNWSITTHVITLAVIIHYFIRSHIFSSCYHVLKLDFISLSWHDAVNVVVFITFLFYTSYIVIRLVLYARYAKHKSIYKEAKREVYELKPSISIEKAALDTTSEDYLATFLSSIKIFGYLEKPVFNELASRLVEKKLRKGTTLFKTDSHDKSFYIVIDGTITVSVEQESPLSSLSSDTERVLAEIKSGDIVSSLFNILSLLSEGKSPHASSSSSPASPSALFTLTKRQGSLMHSQSSSSHAAASANIKICARAKEDSRLLWIPEEAFRAVTAKFPIAAAHITQVILTRFQRVTFITLYKYLGLAQELIQIERCVAKYTSDTQWTAHLDAALKRRSGNGLANREFIFDWSARTDSQTLPSSSAAMAPGNRNDAVDFESLVINETLTNPASNRSRRASNKDMICEVFLSLGEKSLKHVIFESICRLIGLDSAALKAIMAFKPTAKVEDVDFLRRSLKRSENLSTSSLLLESSGRPSAEHGSQDSLFSNYANNIKIFRVKPKELLVEKQKKSPGLFFVLDGIFESFMTLGTDSASLTRSHVEEYPLVDSLPGSLAGYLSTFISHVSFSSVRAKTHGLVAMLERHVVDQLVDRFPDIFLTLASRLVAEVTPIVKHVDFALGWMNVDPGQILCRQGQPSDAIYLVLQGRLRSIKQGLTNDMPDKHSDAKQYFTMDDASAAANKTATIEIMAEHGPGESVGELEVLVDMHRQYTVHAIRETEIAVMPKTLFNYLALIYPETTLKIGRLIACKAMAAPSLPMSTESSCRLKNVAIVPIDPFVPIAYFVAKLKEDLLALGSCLVLDNEKIITVLGKHIFSQLGSLKLQSWLAEQEDVFDLVLYVAGLASSSWTRRCILQADIIFFVGIAGNELPISEYERLVLDLKTTARKELVLLHSHKQNAQKNTRRWLKERPWIMDHHHIRLSFRLPTRDDSMDTLGHLNVFHYVSGRLKQYYRQYQDPCDTFSLKRENDFCRLARRLRGRSIGLVLSGGGARGYAHLGLLKAFEEAGIQVDMIGGTSIGAFMAALYAQEGWSVGLLSKAKSFADRMSCKWRMILDMTYPVVSWFTGHAFNRAMFTLFSDTQIEDLWMNYFCVTTNLTHSVVEVHRSGYLWRYVRASMSLSGFLPPLCDNGSMLLDGGYLNNLPIDVMKSIGAQYVIAIDVGSDVDIGRSDYDDAVSGWWILLQKILGRSVRIPTLEEIQSRLAYVSCHRKQLESMSIDKSYYLRPPVQQFATLQFRSHKEITQIGYDYGLTILREWQANGTLDILKQDRHSHSKCRRHSV